MGRFEKGNIRLSSVDGRFFEHKNVWKSENMKGTKLNMKHVENQLFSLLTKKSVSNRFPQFENEIS